VKGRILLVEDDGDLRSCLAEVLDTEGYAPTTASSGDEAIGLLGHGEKFDLIISDNYMRNGSGLDLLHYVRSKLGRAPAFFLITGQSEMTGEDARKLGAQEFIPKPFDVPELFSLMEKYLPSAPPAAGRDERKAAGMA
jgi:CheY-like chemotaxis protein